MKKIILMVTLFVASYSFASDLSLMFDRGINLNQVSKEPKLLLMANISGETNTIANMQLRYFESADCSGDPLGTSVIYNRLSPVVIKHRNVLKILSAAVYNAGKAEIGDEGMSRTHSIAVRLGAHYSKVARFLTDESFKFTKSYCIKNVECANNLCQGNERFTPYVAMMFADANEIKNYAVEALQEEIKEVTNYMQDYYDVVDLM